MEVVLRESYLKQFTNRVTRSVLLSLALHCKELILSSCNLCHF